MSAQHDGMQHVAKTQGPRAARVLPGHANGEPLVRGNRHAMPGCRPPSSFPQRDLTY